MQEIDGYKRAALALHEMDEQEQAWFLGQIDDEDRDRLQAMLAEIRNTRGLALLGPAKKSPARTESAAEAEAHMAAIEGAPADVLQAVLDVQPDWVIAAVLFQAKKSAALQQYLGQLPHDRAHRIRNLVESTCVSIKPAVLKLIQSSLASHIERRNRAKADGVDFDAVLMQVSG